MLHVTTHLLACCSPQYPQAIYPLITHNTLCTSYTCVRGRLHNVPPRDVYVAHLGTLILVLSLVTEH